MVQLIARAQYDERPVLASDLSFEGDKGVTKQSDLKDTDINAIFKRFEKTGQLPDMIAKNGRYGDFSAVPDYQEAVNTVKLAEEQFLALDVTIRNRFDNDPAKFLAFATDDKNYDEMEKMGLLNEEKATARRAQQAAAAKKAYDDRKAAEKAEKDQEKAALIAEIKADLNKPA
ncbi:MAG: internal scaffolding protein [Arizlama microvirus]|nr:MAG: internal scaffolding protein [Arizlama microvirus]